MMNLRQYFHDVIRQGLSGDFVKALTDGLDPETGTDSSPFSKVGAYGAAYGVWGPMEDSPIKGDREVWNTVETMFDWLCDHQCDDGCWQWFVKATNKSHKYHYFLMVYSWLRLWEDFADHFDPARRGRVERMLRKAMVYRLGVAEKYLATSIHRTGKNIFLSCTMELFLGGRLFGQDEWSVVAAEAMERCLATQSPDGYWPDSVDSRGPATMYNSVSLEAIAIYARLSDSAPARDAVIRAGQYHLRVSYPDGTGVETVDERNRYSDKVSTRCMWTLATLAETRGMSAFFADCHRRAGQEVRAGAIGALQIDAYALVDDEDVPVTGPPEGTSMLAGIKAAMIRRDRWHVCLAGGTTDVPHRPFHHDLQGHLSVWHEAGGLLVGGGNSLWDAKFSSFTFHGRYIADSGEVTQTGSGAVLHLAYGDITAQLMVSFDDHGALCIEARADSGRPIPPDSEFALHLLPGQAKALSAGDREMELSKWSFWHELGREHRRLTLGPLTLEAACDLDVIWPCLPVNIYDPPALLGLDDAILRVSGNLSEGPVRLKLSVT